MAQHSEVKAVAVVSDKQLENAKKETAELLVKLLTVRCKEESKKAFKFEGDSAIRSSFNIFGEVAAKSIFSNPKVVAEMSGLEKYMDDEKLKVLMEPVK